MKIEDPLSCSQEQGIPAYLRHMNPSHSITSYVF